MYGAKIDAIPFLERVDIDLKNLDFSWFNSLLDPIYVLDRLISTFGYFRDDLNILRLIEFASEFNSLDNFIEEWLSSIEVCIKSKGRGLKFIDQYHKVSKGSWRFPIIGKLVKNKGLQRNFLLG